MQKTKFYYTFNVNVYIISNIKIAYAHYIMPWLIPVTGIRQKDNLYFKWKTIKKNNTGASAFCT